MDDSRSIELRQAYADHNRRWQDFLYCYPVISRRSKGLSVGINLNPDKACNFDCIYCQVDRSTPGLVRKVDLHLVRSELAGLLDAAISTSLFRDSPFSALPNDQRVVRDIAFSGDGEPTTFPHFAEAVRLVADLKSDRRLHDTKIVLITDACYLTRPDVAAGLRTMDENNGEIWAKLDAGTQEYYEQVNRPNFPLSHVLAQIREAAVLRPIVIQSLWMRIHGAPPPDEEVAAFAARLQAIQSAGGKLKLVQIYTIARHTAEKYASPLSPPELDNVASIVRQSIDTPLETYYGVEKST
ncbi:MAG: radical SAM protein [Phycisphaerae bacterium]|nr:radical SAM protein [Phycisphaerae bacterium]